ELGMQDGNEQHLGDAVARRDGERLLAAVPARDEHLSLVVGVDDTHEIAQHDAVLVAESRARHEDGRNVAIRDVQREAGGDQRAFAGSERLRRLEAGTDVHSRRTVRLTLRQGELIAQSRIDELDLYAWHGTARRPP